MSETNRSWRVWLKSVITVVLCLVLLGGAALTVWLIYRSEPEAERSGATRRSAALVETVTVTKGDYRPRLTVLGQVEPARDVTLTPRVTGEILDIHPSLLPGGRVGKGQVLLQIDPAEFKAEMAMSRSALQEAQANLELEEGQQRVAKRDFELLDGSVDENQRALAMRQPQLEIAKARVAAAQADLRMARLDLNDTDVKAPFDAKVITRYADIGSRVSPGTPLVRLVGVEEYWIIASVPVADLQWLTFAPPATQPAANTQPTPSTRSDEPSDSSSVEIRSPGRWGAEQFKPGNLERLVGTVDEQTRLARVLITVADPLGLKDGSPLILGTVVEATIQGREVEDVFRINRRSLRANDTVWVMKDEKLEIRDVDVVFSDEQEVFVRGDLQPGEEVVTTDLATTRPGTSLRKMPAATQPEAPSEGNSS